MSFHAFKKRMQSYKRGEDRDLPEKATYELPFLKKRTTIGSVPLGTISMPVPGWNEGPITRHTSLVLPKAVRVYVQCYIGRQLVATVPYFQLKMLYKEVRLRG
jgi:hypothetical protein